MDNLPPLLLNYKICVVDKHHGMLDFISLEHFHGVVTGFLVGYYDRDQTVALVYDPAGNELQERHIIAEISAFAHWQTLHSALHENPEAPLFTDKDQWYLDQELIDLITETDRAGKPVKRGWFHDLNLAKRAANNCSHNTQI